MTVRILCMSDISISGFHYFEVSTFGWIVVKPQFPTLNFEFNFSNNREVKSDFFEKDSSISNNVLNFQNAFSVV